MRGKLVRGSSIRAGGGTGSGADCESDGSLELPLYFWSHNSKYVALDVFCTYLYGTKGKVRHKRGT
jgi:hypothetical protein